MKKLSVAAVSAAVLCGCGSPSVVYHIHDLAKDEAAPEVERNRPAGAISFALRTSNIMLEPTDAAAADNSGGGQDNQGNQTNQGGQNNRKQSGGTSHGGNPPANGNQGGNGGSDKPGPVEQPAKTVKAAELCNGAAEWTACFFAGDVDYAPAKIKATVTPESDGAFIYTAVPDNDMLNLHVTSLAETVTDADELMPTDVSVHYADHTKDIVTNVGSGIASGAALGPYGMLVGGLGGLFSFVNLSASPDRTEPADIRPYICETDLPADGGARPKPYMPDKPVLRLPLVISLNDTLAEGGHTAVPALGGEQCWRLLPEAPVAFKKVTFGEAPSPYVGTGWLYRIRLDKPARESQPRESYFPAGAKITAARSDFPYSSCRKAHLDLTWWAALSRGVRGDGKTGPFDYLTTSIEVADPSNIGVAALPNAGDIRFRSLCGATTAAVPDPNPTAGELINAVLTQVKAVKGLQIGTDSSHGKAK